MANNSFVDYSVSLSDLISKRDQLRETLGKIEEAISSFKVFESLGVLKTKENPILVNSEIDIAHLGVYEAVAKVLHSWKKPTKTADLYQTLLSHGVIKKGTPPANMAVTLYKAIKDKKDCKIRRVGKGEWDAA